MDVPTPDRIELGAIAIVLALLFVGYVVYPTHLVQVSIWLTIITIFICWTGYFIYKLMYDEVVFWE